MYGVEDIATGRRTETHVARMNPYPVNSLAETKELKEMFTTHKNQRELDMDAIRVLALSADSEEWIVQVTWVGFG